MRIFKLKLFSILVVGVVLSVARLAFAEEVQPLDTRQKEIANTVTDKIIERIKALKPQYHALAKFGEAPWFTRGDGDFRYDYKVDKVVIGGKANAKVQPGGCGIYFRLYALGTPSSPWIVYYGWCSIGGDRAGITHELGVAVYRKSDDDDTNGALVRALQGVEQAEADTTFAWLTSEYILSKKGVGLDVPSLLSALEIVDPDLPYHRFDNTSVDAMTTLRFCKLTPEQLDRIKQGFQDGKYPMCDAYVALQIVDEQDHASLPAFMDDLIAVSLQVEQRGKDTFQKTPFFGQGWMSDARYVRLDILSFFKDGNPADLEPAGQILSGDTDLNNRLQALNYIAKQPGADAQKLLIGALQNSFRSIQVEAAQDCAQKKIIAAADTLRLLLGSSSSKVREAAAVALKQLGQTVPGPVSLPPLPDAARQIAAALWVHGLRDDDFLTLHALPWLGKAQMTSFDASSIKKVTDVYAVRKLDRTVPWIHTTPPGPFILAAAIKFNDEESARLVYGRMCDVYETDEAALSDGLDNLGWDRFSVALDQFHHKNDDAAVAKLNEVIALSDAAKPFTPLSIYVNQSKELLDYLKSKPPEKDSLVPESADADAYVKYWIGQLKDCDGENPSEAGVKIRAIGLHALPLLINALSDKTPTRNFSYGRSYLPQRDFIYVGDAAKNIIRIICQDYGYNPLGNVEFANTKSPELQEKLRVWLKKVPADAKPLSRKLNKNVLYLEGRDVLYPAGEYYWGDD